MKAIIICVSISNGNTRKIAEAIGEVLEARVVEPEEVDFTELSNYDLVGFGSGIYYMNFHKRLRALVKEMPVVDGGNAFVFTTSGVPEPGFVKYASRFSKRIAHKGFNVRGNFSCRGLDTWGPLKLFGGVNVGRPHADDIQAARDFAQQLRTRVS